MVTLYRVSDALLGAFPQSAMNPAPRFVLAWQGAVAMPNQIDLAAAGGAGVFAFLSAKTGATAAQQGAGGWANVANSIRALAPAQCCWLGDTPGIPSIETGVGGVLSNAPVFAISAHLAVGVEPGTRFGIDPNGNGLTIDANGVAQGLTIRPRQIGSSAFGDWVPLNGSLLLFVGQNSPQDETGQFRFAAAATDQILADLNLDLRYFKATKAPLPGQLLATAVKTPVFALGNTPTVLRAGLDPLGDPKTPASLGWFQLNHADGVSPLPTNFITVHGHRLHVVPRPSAKVVFSRTVQALNATGGVTDRALSLTPSGPHEMHVPTDPTPAGEHYLLTGNRGTELLPFAVGDAIDFAAGNPAFDQTTLLHTTTAPASLLSDLGHTAWLAVQRRAGGGMDYIVQTQEAPLRQPIPHLAMLTFADGRMFIPAGTDKPHVPMLPLTALGLSAEASRYTEAVDLETRVIAPSRLSVMRARQQPALAAAAALGPGTATTTPQGFLVDVIGDEWQRVTIALSESTVAPKLILERPANTSGQSWLVQEALQRRAVFLVVTGISGTPVVLGTADLSITVAGEGDQSRRDKGWAFRFELPGWPAKTPSTIALGDDPPILIIKFSDRPIATSGQPDAARPPLVPDLKAWTMPEVFSPDIGGKTAQAALQQHIADIVRESQSSDTVKAQAFTTLVQRLVNPYWNGVMMLGATMDTPPDEIAAIRAGLPSDFPLQAVCIGIDANKIAVTQTPPPAGGGPPPPPSIELQKSAVFALVSYPPGGTPVDPPAWVSGNYGIAFQVTRLLLQVENSAVACFACDARLRLPSFLGGIAAAEGPTDDEGQTDKALIELHGKYEKRATGPGVFLLSSDVSSDGTALTPIDFQDVGGVMPALKRLTVTRIQLACSLEAGQTSQFACAFTIAGKLDFEPFPKDFPAIAITGLAFDSATVTLNFGLNTQNKVTNAKYDVDLGPLRLTVDKGADLGSGLLKGLPFRLSALHFSDFRPRLNTLPLSVGSLGMVTFDLGAVKVLENFDFGLEFSLDLGGFGGLVSAARKLSASIVIGWPDFRRYSASAGPRPPWLTNLPLSIGFRLDGGGGALDLGIEGILKITAESANLHTGQGGIAIKLNKCQIDVLGQTLPGLHSELDFFIYLPSNAPDRPAWFGCYSGDTAIGPIHLKLLSVAQRLKMFAGGVPYTTADAVARIKDIGAIQDPSELLGKQVTYDPGAGWSFGLSGEFTDVVGIDAVLADPVPVYGLRVSIPPDGSLFAIDALYTRIADDIGVYSVEIAPPASFRQIFLGPVEIDIGNLGLQVFSDGSWTFDLGFPRGLDFTRSFVAQVGPFIGFGGMYVASRDARTTTLLAGKNCVRVLEMGVAVRVGLGRQVQQGLLTAGASITVFGILEGAFGVTTAGGRAVHLIGQVGLIAEVYGYVNFAIVRASVSVRVWADITVDIETGEPVILSIDAGVSVRVSVVIGHIHFWRVDIEIRISFSFDARLHFSWTLGARDGASAAALAFAAAPPPLQWTPATVYGTPKPLDLVVALDASARFLGAGQAEAVMVVLLSATDGKTGDAPVPALADLLEGLLRWTLMLAGHAQPGAPVPDDALDAIWQGLILSDSLNRLGPQPLAMPVIAQFLKQNFAIKVNVPGPADTANTSTTGVLMPILPDLAVSLVMPGGGGPTIDFGDVASPAATVCDGVYEDALNRWFARQAALLSSQPNSAQFAAAADTRTAATILFEDWIGHLVKQIFALLQQSRDVRPAPPPATIDELVKAVRDAAPHITGLAARMLAGGLRAPVSADPAAGTKALYELTQQQIFAVPAGIGGATGYTMKFAAARGADWFTVSGPVADAPIDVAAARDLAVKAGSLPPPNLSVIQELPVVTRAAVSTAAVPIATTIDAARRTIWTLPTSLLTRFGQPGPTPIRVSLSIPPASDAPQVPGTAVPPPLQWATKIDFGLRQTFAVNPATSARTPINGVYQVVGANKANRDAIQRLPNPLPVAKEGRLMFMRNGNAVVDTLAAGDVVLVKTNFSTEPMPPDAAAAALAAAPQPASADITADLQTFLSLLFECSVVNGTGFWLRYWPGAGNLDNLFAPGADGVQPTSVSISLVVIHGDLPTDMLRPEVNTLISGATTEKAIRIEQPDIPAAHTAFQQGNVALRVSRPNPDPNHAADPLGALAARYSLLVCSTPAVPGVFFTLDADAYIPVAPNRDDPDHPQIGAPPPTTNTPQNEADAPTWFYRVEVPFWRIAVANNDTDEKRSLVADPDPYIGVGRTALAATLGWRDLYGNAHVGGDTHLNNLRLDYCDLLNAPAEWPRMAIAWAPGVATGTVNLTLTFLGYTPPSDGSGAWFATYYLRLFHQLKQPDVTATLTAGSATPLDVKAQLVGLIGGIQPDGSGNFPARAPIAIVVPAKFASDGIATLTRAQVTLSIARNRALVTAIAPGVSAADIDARFAAVRMDVAPDLAPYKPAGKDPGNAIAWAAFAKAFETVYPTLRFLKSLDTSTSALAAAPTTTTGPVYCAPRALLAPAPKAGASAITFAPTPLSRSLMSGTVQLPCGDLAPGTAIPGTCPSVQVSDVDLDGLAARYLAAIEQVLSPAGSLNLRRADATAFEAIAAAKESLARNLAQRVNVVVTGDDGTGLLGPARAAFRNRVRADLSAAYRIGAVVALACEPYGTDSQSVARLLGTPSIATASGIKILPAKLDRATAEHNPVLTFVIEWDPLAVGPDPTGTAVPAAAGQLGFAANFVELPGPGSNPLGDEYIPSDWFQPLTGVSAVSFGAVNIPLPLRQYPTRPKLVLQSNVDPGEFAKKRHDPQPNVATVADRARLARTWHYAMDLTHDLAPGRDQLDLVAEYGTVDRPELAAVVPRTAFDALVTFDKLWPTLGPRLAQLVALGLNDGAVSGYAADARQLAWLCRDLADALDRALPTVAAPATTPPKSDTGTIAQQSGGILVARLTTPSPIAHELIAFAPGSDPWAIFDPPQPSSTPGLSVSSKPTSGTGQPGIRPMRAILSHLDVLTQQTAVSTFKLTRNASLGGRAIREDFVYHTEPTAFPNRFVPNLRDDDPLYLINETGPIGSTLDDYLKRFLAALLAGATSELAVSIAGSLATPLTQGAGDARFGPQWAIYPLPAVPAMPAADLGAVIAQTLSGEIAAAMKARNPAIRPGMPKPEIRFEIVVFGETSVAQVPLLTLSDVFIGVDDFKNP
jgi:hypothetical protein